MTSAKTFCGRLDIFRTWVNRGVRPSLEKLFERDGKKKAIRDRMIWAVVKKHRYSQMEVARHLKLHHSMISRLIKDVNDNQR